MSKYAYKVVKDEETNDFFHAVVERTTNQVIDYFFFEDDCQDYLKFLNKGGAFDGFTPSFILNKVEVRKDVDINTKFDRMLT